MDMDDSRLGSIIDEWEDGDNDVYARVIQGSDSSLTPAYSHSGRYLHVLFVHVLKITHNTTLVDMIMKENIFTQHHTHNQWI